MKIHPASSQEQLQFTPVKVDEEKFPSNHSKPAREKGSSGSSTENTAAYEDIFEQHGTFVCADINADGRDEIIHQNLKDGVVAYTLHETSDGDNESFPENHILPNLMSDPSWKLIGAGRYGWHHSEALFFQNKSTGTLIANMISRDWFNQSDVISLPKEFPSKKYEVVGVADFNNDRHSDIFLRDRKSGELFVRLLKEQHIEDVEDPRTVIPFESDSGIDPRWKILGIGSFHKDGRSDIVSRHPDGRTKVSIYQGVHRIGETMLEETLAGHIVGVGDIDGDGSSDLLRLDEEEHLSASFMNGIYEQREDELFYIVDSAKESGARKHRKGEPDKDFEQ